MFPDGIAHYRPLVPYGVKVKDPQTRTVTERKDRDIGMDQKAHAASMPPYDRVLFESGMDAVASPRPE
jgi:hypothetical protein